jgi:ethanolamine utilization protein EutN
MRISTGPWTLSRMFFGRSATKNRPAKLRHETDREEVIVLLLCKVIGQAVSTLKDERLGRHRMLIVGTIGDNPHDVQERFVALDTVGAGEGMMVGVIQGAPSQTAAGKDVPTDAAIVAIFDALRMDGKQVYEK